MPAAVGGWRVEVALAKLRLALSFYFNCAVWSWFPGSNRKSFYR